MFPRHNNIFRELTDPNHTKIKDMLFHQYRYVRILFHINLEFPKCNCKGCSIIMKGDNHSVVPDLGGEYIEEMYKAAKIFC